MVLSSKNRRNSGRKQGKVVITASRQYIIDNCLEPRTYWNDWIDYRDGFRDIGIDRTKIYSNKKLENFDYLYNIDQIEHDNKKLRRLVGRRKARIRNC